MRKESLKNILYKRFKALSGEWIPKYKIEEKSRQLGFLAENGTRRTREMVQDGILEQREVKGIAEYRYVPKQSNIQVVDGRAILQTKSLFE